MNKKGKKKKTKRFYTSDVIAYYANSQHNKFPNVDSEDVHLIAQQVFGTSYYVDFDTLVKDGII